MSEAQQVLARDPLMRGLMAQFAFPTFELRPPFETLARSIVGQQLSGKAAESIWQRLIQPTPLEPLTLYQTPPETLRSLGLSRAKASYLIDLARFALEGKLADLDYRSDQELIAHLTQIRGVGVWTVQMYLMFGLARPDVWPVLDLGIRKGAQWVYGIDSREGLLELGQRFQPFRSYAAWYLWRSLEA